jgi:hypothetical protein
MSEAPRDGNYVPSLLAKDSVTGITFPVKGDALTGRIFADTNSENMGLGIPEYDYVGIDYPTATTETYTFKTGGSGGTTVATVTLTYTDATKADLSSVAKI